MAISKPTWKQCRVLGMQPGQHVRSELPRGIQQIFGILFLDNTGLVIETGMAQLRTFREVNERCLLPIAKGEFQGIDPKRMMSRRPLLKFEAAGVQCKFAKQQCSVVCVREAAIVAQSSHTGIGKFAVDDAHQVTHFGDGRLMGVQVPDLQPVLQAHRDCPSGRSSPCAQRRARMDCPRGTARGISRPRTGPG